MIASPETLPLLAELLADQQRLDTPVARFSRAHESGALGLATSGNLVAERRSLIPLSAPRPGEQYAFEVDLDACTGCKACVSACHSLNGLDEDETWRDVGLLVSTDRRHPFSQTITTACHHCADPACLHGCPVLAYEKDPRTGIVRHLDDQCIGCSYCVLKCPYDVPKYSKRRGIVRKCDLCHDRLVHGEPPACAQACPTQAIRIVVVASPASGSRSHPPRTATAADARQNDLGTFLPGAPDPSYTRPTTRYVTRRTIPADVAPADAASLRPQPPHWPLVVLLTFMALATGCSILAAAESLLGPAIGTHITHAVSLLGWVAGSIGLGGSILHLGQPRRAWRIFLGLRTSWLSREAIVFGAWFAVASLLVTTPPSAGIRTERLILFAAGLAILGLFCSAMIYADTRRELWRFGHTAPRFFGSAAVLGLAAALACSAAAVGAKLPALSGALAFATVLKMVIEAQALAPLNGDRDTPTPALKTARLLVGPLRSCNELRVAAGILGGVLVPVLIATRLAPSWSAWVGFAFAGVGELLERSLYFRAVVAPKMPGVPE